MTTDPSVVRSVAVHAEDLLAALEADARGEAETVLRMTPPFSGRMRARLHVVQDGPEEGTVHLSPTLLVDDVPPYPTPDRTADELREAAADYSVDRHHTYHEQRVTDWRDRLLDHVVESLHLSDFGREINVAVLGP